MTHASIPRTRLWRAVAAFVVLLSAVVLVPGSEIADAAGEAFEIQKTVDHNTISTGVVSTWTLTIDTNDEVTAASGVSVTDVVPDGLCPYGAGSTDCPGGVSPSPAYTSATENADGTWILVWDLPNMGTSEQAIITYTTLTGSHYREDFAAAGPVLARDSWNNLAHLSGTVDGAQLDDYSSAGQGAWGALLMTFGCALVTAAASRGYPLFRS